MRASINQLDGYVKVRDFHYQDLGYMPRLERPDMYDFVVARDQPTPAETVQGSWGDHGGWRYGSMVVKEPETKLRVWT